MIGSNPLAGRRALNAQARSLSAQVRKGNLGAGHHAQNPRGEEDSDERKLQSRRGNEALLRALES